VPKTFEEWLDERAKRKMITKRGNGKSETQTKRVEVGGNGEEQGRDRTVGVGRPPDQFFAAARCTALWLTPYRAYRDTFAKAKDATRVPQAATNGRVPQ
jgi:hypothetical protein